MQSSAFLEAYRSLNRAQRTAVDTIEGPVMVIAGPGTGKTQILTIRIANILAKTDTSPESILALTFTEAGARAMRERLASYIGSSAYRVPIHTFHEFAGMLIRAYPEAYERAVGGTPISDLDKITLVESLIEGGEIRKLRPHGNSQLYVKPIIAALSLMKREFITPDTFAEIIARQETILSETPRLHEKGAHKGKVRGEYIDREKQLLKNRELLFVYRAYESALATTGRYDFDDMIFETVKALERDEDMLRSLQETYQYILADEHQDVNGSQNRILELLAAFHERPNLFVVGDEKQAIYRFQGASLENFLYFEEKFPHTKTIALTENYRSTQNILDLSHELIKTDAGDARELRVPLSSTSKKKGKIERRTFSHEAVEHEYIVNALKHLIAKEQVLPEDIAIILRTNREVEEIATLIRKHGIAADASADGDILYHPITTSIRALIRALISPHDEDALARVLLSGYPKIGVEDVVRIMRARTYDTPLRMIVSDAHRLETLGVNNVMAVLRVSEVLRTAYERASVEAPHRVLEYALRESGLLKHAIAHDPYEGGKVIRRIYDEVEEMVRHDSVQTLADVARMFESCALHKIALNAPSISTHQSAVRIMTAHRAKGLEFKHVFIPHLVDSRWGGSSHAEFFHIPITRHEMSKEPAAFDDERKLLYVAITRAKEGCYFSSSEMSAEGRALLPSRLLEGIGESLIEVQGTERFEKDFDPTASVLHTDTRLPIDSALLMSVLAEHGFSVTALNNYMKSPWNYFFRNVLHIPEVKNESAQFGTALHDALRSVMHHRRTTGELPSIGTLKTYIERELSKLPITHTEYTRLHERALVALTLYLEQSAPSFPHETKEEYPIEVLLPTGDPAFPEVRLTGKLDRLDFDAGGNIIRVVDYKSGAPKTRGVIEGTTKDSTGDYKRQLTFYALLLSLQTDERLKCREGLLSFIEADERGRIHEEAYTITDEEMEALRKEIIQVVLEIAHGAFLNAPCDPAKSDYCELVDFLREG